MENIIKNILKILCGAAVVGSVYLIFSSGNFRVYTQNAFIYELREAFQAEYNPFITGYSYDGVDFDDPWVISAIFFLALIAGGVIVWLTCYCANYFESVFGGEDSVPIN